MDTKQVVARFEAERQALALMDHPNIARVLDAGATETGRPFFVMELVQGVPITQFCDRNKLPARERLELFIPVCQAIQHAHQKGIIHRDIKPSNVLVSLLHGEPIAKVIDFGVAKATHQKLTQKTLFTNYSTMVGTPAYMSPEQAEMTGIDIDTRTDVYSLGVLLYELLTGTTPFPEKRLRSAGFGEMQRIIAEEEPEKPSTRLSSMLNEQSTSVARTRSMDVPALRRILRGDLDVIVMKCLEKDRRRRYDTAKGFANDIRRYLNSEPIEAMAPSLIYLFGKFAYRHKAALVVAAALAALLTGGTVISTWQAIRATAAREKERAAKEEARAAERATASALNVSQRVKAELALDKAQLLGEQGDANLALLWLARSLQLAPRDAEDLRRVIRASLGGWQTRICSLQLVLPHQGRVDRVAFTPDGGMFFTAARVENRGVVLQRWDARDGHPIGSPIERLDGMVYLLTFSSDAEYLAIGYVDGRFELVRCTNGHVRPLQLRPETGAITAITFNPSGTIVFVASSIKKEGKSAEDLAELDESSATLLSGDRSFVQLVRVETGEQLLEEVLLFELPVWAAAFSPDGQSFVTESGPWADANRNGFARFWSIAGKELRSPLVHASPALCVAWSSDGTKLLTGHWDFCACIWNAQNGQMVQKVSCNGPVSSVQFNPADETTFLTASFGGTVRLWGTVRGEALSPPMWHQNLVRNAIFSPDGRRILSGVEGAVTIRDVRSATLSQARIPFPRDLIPVVLDQNGTILATDKQNVLQLRRSDNGALIGVPISHPLPVLTGAFSRNLRFVATIGIDRKVRIWESANGRMIVELPAQEPAFCVTFSPDSQTLASGHFGAMLIRWDTASWKPIDRFFHQLHSGPVFTVEYSENGKSILTGGADGTARVWDEESGRELASIHHSTAVVANFNRHTTVIVTGGTDHTARLWDVKTHRPVGRPMDHQGCVFDAKFSDDGKTILTGSADHTARLWDVLTGKQIGPSWHHTESVMRVAYWPDRKGLVALTAEKGLPNNPAQAAVHYWELPSTLIGNDQEIELWAQVATGSVLETNGSVRVSDANSWQEQIQRLRKTNFKWP